MVLNGAHIHKYRHIQSLSHGHRLFLEFTERAQYLYYCKTVTLTVLGSAVQLTVHTGVLLCLQPSDILDDLAFFLLFSS